MGGENRRNTAIITPTSKFKIMNFYLISSLTFVILTWVSSGDALKCNQCTSHEHTQCGDPFYYEDELGNKTYKKQFEKECPLDDGNGNEYTLCGKIYQVVRGNERIIRSCGYEESTDLDGKPRQCYSTVLEEYNTYVCTCKGDNCNGSNTLGISIISCTLSVILAVFFK